jgi:tetratricopeptide (TPR) repeat protein
MEDPPEDFLRRLAREGAFVGPAAPGAVTSRTGGTTSMGSVGADAGVLPEVPGYRVLGVLGRGGMGVVYRALQVRLNRVVALKMVLAGPHAGPEELARFRREAEAVARLQHPHVVQIYEVGEHGGRPYFSMEYVEGASLAQHLSGNPLPGRTAAPLVETLARAVHHAHERGIVHRDLKPANVLIQTPGGTGNTGEEKGSEPAPSFPVPPVVKITDFGLAKRLDVADGPTRSGAVMGTPSYMAPEQARGRNAEVGPATDLYALGAILYEALTGRPPFRGESNLDTLGQVVEEEPVPPRRLQPRLARDLDTICLKCLEKEPARRYPSALALAEDLERWRRSEPIRARPSRAAERAWKWARRRPAVAGLLTGLLVVVAGSLAGLTALWLRAEREGTAKEVQRDRARAHFAMAREAVDQFDTAVSQSADLKAHGLEPLRKKLLESAAQFYERFVQEETDDHSVRAEQARGYDRLAVLYAELDLTEPARQASGRGLEIHEKLALDHPESSQYQVDLFECLRVRGDLSMRVGKYGQAEDDWHRGHTICRQLADRDPAEPGHRQRLAEVETSLAILYQRTGRAGLAEKAFKDSIEQLNDLSRARPENPRYKAVLAKNHITLGLLHADAGRSAEAEQHLGAAHDLLSKLAEDHPEVPDYRRDLAYSLLNLGHVHERFGRETQAERAWKEALTPLEKLRTTHPQVAEYAYLHAKAQCGLGIAYVQTGRPGLAKEAWKSARETLGRLVESYPDRADYREELANAHNGLGTVYREEENSAEAAAAFRSAVEGFERLASAHPTVPNFQYQLATCHFNLGELFYYVEGRTGPAEEAWDRALAVQKILLAANPAVPDYRHQLARFDAEIGGLYAATHRFEPAEAALRQALTFLQELDAERYPERPVAVLRAYCWGGLGAVCRDQGRCDEALAWYARAAEALQAGAPDPGAADVVAMIHEGRALTLDLLARFRDALADWDKAAEHTPQPHRARLRAARAVTLAHAGDVAQALAQVAPLVEDEKAAAKTLYHSARVYALGAGAARQGPQAEQFGAKAVGLLRRAHEARLFQEPAEMARLTSDSDLQSVRARSDFRDLLELLERARNAPTGETTGGPGH